MGKKEPAEQAFNMLDKNGKVRTISMTPQGIEIYINGQSILAGNIQWNSTGSNRFRVAMPRHIEFYRQGRLKLDEIISKRIKIEDMWDPFLAGSVIMVE